MSGEPAGEKARRSRLGVNPSLLEGARLVWGANPRKANLFAATGVLLGLVPTGVALCAGLIVGSVPGAVEAGSLDSAPGRRLLLGIAIVTALYIAREIVNTYRNVYLMAFMNEVEGEADLRTMSALLTPPTVRHLEDPEYQELVSLATNVIWPNRNAFTEGLFQTIPMRVTGFTSALVVAGFRWDLALVIAATWIVSGRPRRKALARLWSPGTEQNRRAMYYRSVALEPLAAKEMRVFGLAGWTVDRFSDTWMAAMRDVWRERRPDRAVLAAAMVAVAVVHGWAFWVLGSALADGRISVGAAAAVATAIFGIADIGSVTGWDHYLAAGAASMPAVKVLEERVTTDEQLALTGSLPADDLPRRTVRFEGVHFCYPGRDLDVYAGLDLEIEAGRSLAIVGANGAGKTTLVKLLARLYDPTAGRILVDGTDLREIDAPTWQRRVAAIFQDFNRYELTFRENIAFGAVEHIDNQALLDRAVERAGAADIVASLPLGWETPLSRRFPGGVDLSGGQWQRVALARALAAVEAGAGILVLDEPTAHLDVRAEVELFDQFLEVTKGVTTVLISHRFSTVRRAHRIVVLDAGQVVEDGSHAELLALGGRYARMFTLQSSRYTDADELTEAEAGHG